MTTLVDVLRNAGAGTLTILDRPDDPVQLSYEALWTRALRRLGALHDAGVVAGDHVVLQLGAAQEFVETFWACVLGGIVPVPLAPVRHRGHRDKLAAVVERLGRPWVVADPVATERMGLEVPVLAPALGETTEPAAVTPSDVALLQFSSGATGDPKGVVLTHDNLVANLRAMASRTRATPEDVALSWMPLSHDMGLIGFHLGPIATGCDHVLMRPSTFLGRPERWLEAASRYRATLLASPCFGLAWALDRATPDPAWDLSAVRLVFVGSDLVSARTCRRFADRFGLPRQAMYPVYGLAEATVAVTFPEPGAGVVEHRADGRSRVEVGTPLDGVEVRIEGGEIQVRGRSVSSGYFGEPPRDGWLGTGDLGTLVDGRLVVTGRAKDVVFLAGETHHLPDLDRVVHEETGLDVASAVLPDGEDGERLVLFVKYRRGAEAFAAVGRRAVDALYAATGLAATAMPVPSLPRTTSGKVRRHALVQLWDPEAAVGIGVRQALLDVVRRRSGRPGLGPHDRLLDAGIPSIVLVEVARDLREELGIEVGDVDLFAFPTVARLADHLEHRPRPVRRARPTDEPIAVVGLGIAVPGAEGPSAYWDLLWRGVDAVVDLPPARRGDVERFLGRAAECPPGGYLDRVDLFDPSSFGLTRHEAALTHPAQRLLLETVARALHDAGVPRGTPQVGLYVGHISDLEGTRYRDLIEAADPGLLGLAVPGNLGSFLAGRLAHILDLQGPAVVVDTACSASLVAVHMACDALRRGACQVAVAGGARVSVVPTRWPVEIGFESRLGRCRSFDADADGIVLGEGAGAVVLMPLPLARERGHRVYATIAGSAVNADGAGAGLTAPNPDAQARVVADAWAGLGTPAFVEAHGAGTRLSDRIEVEALSRAFPGAPAFPIGSVKSNLGHLFDAAGVAGLIKAVLALWHGVLPPTLHVERPSPLIPFDRAPVFVNTEPHPIHGTRAGVTSLGFSGTNCHVVVERADPAGEHAPLLAFDRVRCWVDLPERVAEVPEIRKPVVEGLGEEQIRRRLRRTLLRYSDVDLDEVPAGAGFFEIGLDSVVLIQVRQAVERAFGIRIEAERLFEEIPGPDALVEEIARGRGRDRDRDRDRGRGRARVRDRARDRGRARPFLPPPYVTDLCTDIAARFPSSRDWAERARRRLASPRFSAARRPGLEDLAFPLVWRRAEGAWIEDADGNRLLDVSMGFGVHLFGHAPPFVRAALERALDAGAPLGPIAPVASRVAERLHRLTGHDRVAFYSSGSEAVMVAIRLARAVTGRRAVVVFDGSYHGHFDGVLASRGPDGRGVPFAAGTPPGMTEDVVVLEYGRPEALDAIWALGDQLAAVVVEPVQSRHPSLVPLEFLRELRGLTGAQGAALVFDEVITGLRLHRQGMFGVVPDLATYGKVLGGGLPIGAVAGGARFLDAIDGPDPTFVAGTFCNHPLAMAAADAVLEQVESDPDLQRRLDAATASLCADLARVLAGTGIGIQRCGSLFRFDARGPAEVLYPELLRRGVYVWEGRTCFWSTAHGPAEHEALVQAVAGAVAEMRGAGVLSEWRPLNDEQRRTLSQVRASEAAALAFHQPACVQWPDADPERIGAALVRAARAHEMLRVRRVTEHGLELGEGPNVELAVVDGDLDAVIRGELCRPVDLDRGPFWRVLLVGDAVVLLTHRLVADGWSMGLVLRALAGRAPGPGVPYTSRPPHPVREVAPAEPVWSATVRHQALAPIRARDGASPFAVLLTAFLEQAPGARVPMRDDALAVDQRNRLVAVPAPEEAGFEERLRAVRSALAHPRDANGEAWPVVTLDRAHGVEVLPCPALFTAHPLVVSALDLGDRLEVQWKAAPHEAAALDERMRRLAARLEELR